MLGAGSHGWAGDIVGHILVDASDGAARCPCGRSGHLEAYVSGPALAARYERATGMELHGDLRPVAQRALAGEPLATTVLREGASLLGRAVGGVVNLVDPDLVVFGGSLVDVQEDVFWDHTVRALEAEVRAGVLVPCMPAKLGTDAAVVGAALAARDAIWS